MKVLFALLSVFLLLSGVVYAQDTPSGTTTLLNGVETTGASGPGLGQTASQHTVQVEFTNLGGGVTALIVALEGSVDGGVTWYPLHTYTLNSAELSAKRAMFHTVNKSVFHIRVNIITLTETGTTAVTVKYRGSRQ